MSNLNDENAHTFELDTTSMSVDEAGMKTMFAMMDAAGASMSHRAPVMVIVRMTHEQAWEILRRGAPAGIEGPASGYLDLKSDATFGVPAKVTWEVRLCLHVVHPGDDPEAEQNERWRAANIEMKYALCGRKAKDDAELRSAINQLRVQMKVWD